MSQIVSIVALLLANAAGHGEEAVQWKPAQSLALEGRGWADVKSPFDRLPARAEGVVPSSVWHLSRHSAGMAVRFVTNANRVRCRWTLTSGSLAMPHMPATGVSGVDLYVRRAAGEQVTPGQVWRWCGAGRPAGRTTDTQVVGGLPEGEHEFLLYLPLYNGVTEVAVGVPEGATLQPAPSRPASLAKPIVFYGTSITQGGCASRPGMAYPALLGRWLDRPTINLGFSGNGKMDAPVVELLAELEVAAYVIDCCPNMNPDLIAQRTAPLVHRLRTAHPDTPIMLVENIEYQAAAVLPGTFRGYTSKNEALRLAHDKLVAEGLTGLYYVPGKQLYGADGEAAVDGTHATDLGFFRLAEGLLPVLREALGG